MEGRFAVPFHFAVEFLVLITAVGAALDALRARRHGARAWSLGQAAGFASLAGAQLVHGSLLQQSDAAPVVLGLRLAGFVLLALSVRPAAHVLPAFAGGGAFALFLPGAHAAYALAPAVAAFAVAGRGFQAHREDQDPATFAFTSSFVAFAIAEIAIALAQKDGGWLVTAAHVSRALAALFLARWLYSSVVRSVRMRFVAAIVTVLTITVLLVGGALNVVVGDRIQGDQLDRLSSLGDARVKSIYERGESSIRSARLFASLPSIQAPKNDAELAGNLAGLAKTFGPDFVVAIDGKGRVRASVENLTNGTQKSLPVTRAGSIAGTAVVKDGSTTGVQRISFTGKSGFDTQLIAVGSAEILRSGTKVGVIAVGYRIDGAFLRTVASDTGGADATIVTSTDDPITTTIPDTVLAVKAFRSAEAALRTAREENRAVSRVLSLGGTTYATVFVPIETQRDSGQVIGLLALSLRSDVIANAQIGVTRTLFFVTLLAMLLAALLAWLTGGRVTRPIRSLTQAARELREGNMTARARVTGLDEVGALGSAFNEMAEDIQKKTGDLRTSAKAEATLRARIEAILQSMGDGLIATDEAGGIVTFNRAAEQMFKRRAESVMGKRLAEEMHGATSAGKSLADFAMRGTATEGTLRVGKTNIPIALTAAPLLDAAGRTAGRVIVVRDVTSEHQAERMKSEFLANVSHELRTPITPIKGFAEILSRKKFPREKVMAFLEGILESTARLERIADILVDFAALEAGRLKPKTEPVPIRGLLDGLTERWRERDRIHQFVRRGGADLPPVIGDQRLLSRSLDELVDNAVKFSPDGGQIEIMAEPYANGARGKRPSKVLITVRDHGIGIEPERMPDLFQDFRQLDGSETRSFGGLGLGLAYVKRIATVHGGEVLVESKPNRGSSFSLVLPVAERGTHVAQKPAPRRKLVRAKSKARR